jgi:DNA ligase-1
MPMQEFQNDIIADEKSRSGFSLFSSVIGQLGTLTGTNDKMNLLANYFKTAPEKDRVWLIALFSGRRPKRPVQSGFLSLWAAEIANLPAWLYEECYHVVGDLAETIALLIPQPVETGNLGTLHDFMLILQQLENKTEPEKKEIILQCWQQMNEVERFVFNKLITGSFRIGVSKQLMINALAKATGEDASLLAHRLSGSWDPYDIGYETLVLGKGDGDAHSRPYPFCLAYAIEGNPEDLGEPLLWQAEWKWDGIRGQLIKRNNDWFVWSRGEELMTEKFPELQPLQHLIPDGTVLDGEVLIARDGKPLPFSLLQTRIGRKNISKKQLLEAPVCFFAFDLLEWNGEDWRQKPLHERRLKMEEVNRQVNHPRLLISPAIQFNDWNQLAETRENSRDNGSEGLMLKKLDSIYQVGRKRGDWWKWKIDPMTIDAVLIYAQKGHGRRSNLYSDYTFAVRDGEKLISFTKAYSGLTDKEIAEVDSFVKRNAIEKFGPVRTVKPELVFEIVFEGIAASNRHKSGVALRFPRMSRWRKDKKPEDINTLEDLKDILKQYNTTGAQAGVEDAAGEPTA